MDLMLHTIRSKFSDVSHVSTEDLAKWTESSRIGCNSGETTQGTASGNGDLIVIDARPEEEFVISHIEGAIRMEHCADEKTISTFVRDNLKLYSDVSETPPKQKTVVCYCSLGYRSSALARVLQKEIIVNHLEGLVKVYNLEGSLFKWANENRQMVNGDGSPTIYAHPYNTVFGLTLKKELRKYK